MDTSAVDCQRQPVVLDPSGHDIHAETARLRERGPVVPVILPGGVPAWSVTSHELIKRLMTHPSVSKDAYRHWPAWINGDIPRDWPLSLWISVRSMITAYGADHTRLRKLVSTAFTARRTAALRPRVEEITAGLLDRLEGLPPGQPVDLRAEFASPLPIQVICELFGIPTQARDALRHTIDLTFMTALTVQEAQENGERLYQMLDELVTAKRAAPGADLTSGLIAARDDGDGSGLSRQELVDTLLLMISAGYETTINLIGHAVHLLLTHPEQLRMVRTGEVSWADVIEETLRVEPPGANVPLRYAVEDIELGGVTIPRGDAILVSLAGAGRDPEQHGSDADRFDPARPTRRDHLSFGHGVHRCLGAPLARLEVSVALPALFSRFPDLALAAPSETLGSLNSFISNGHRRLPVVLGDHNRLPVVLGDHNTVEQATS
ncbi:cytochrome P450 [Streptomyces ferralitis]|uniref:Cytochrome P450 n=3 Tax=Streptantibioticus ferralitis TaxID=236510 RepID=A0ABT5Z3U8_9ACTN|nr:cytochrome P450 [Streptantibioticus ferralitis]